MCRFRRGLWFPCQLRCRCLSPFSGARPCHEWRLGSTTQTNLNMSGLSNARSGTHPDRSRRVRFDVDVDGSSHLLVHVFCEGSSCRAVNDSVEVCFSGAQCSHFIGCIPRNPLDVLHGIPALRAWNSVPRFLPNLSLRELTNVAVLLMIESEHKLVCTNKGIFASLASRRLPSFRGFVDISLSLFTQN